MRPPSLAKMATLGPAAQHMSDVVSFDADLASFLSSSKEEASSYKVRGFPDCEVWSDKRLG